KVSERVSIKGNAPDQRDARISGTGERATAVLSQVVTKSTLTSRRVRNNCPGDVGASRSTIFPYAANDRLSGPHSSIARIEDSLPARIVMSSARGRPYCATRSSRLNPSSRSICTKVLVETRKPLAERGAALARAKNSCVPSPFFKGSASLSGKSKVHV